MERVPGGFVYTVPEGWRFHCPLCPKSVTLEPGDECYVKTCDDSHVYCKKHFPFLGAKRADEAEPEAEEEPERRAPRRGHRREEQYAY